MPDLLTKWKEILDHPKLPAIKDPYRRLQTAMLLENQEIATHEQAKLLKESYPTTDAAVVAGTAATGGGFDPILIQLVRRAMPLLMAYDWCGVQTMQMPTGIVFAMKSRYATGSTLSSDAEALYVAPGYDVNTAYSGTGISNGTDIFGATGFNTGTGMATSAGESLTPVEMGFTIEKVTVTAKTRALKSEYTLEMAQDLKSVQGLDAEGELSNILSAEIMFEINREVIRTIYYIAKTGAQKGTSAAGVFDLDLDSDGRWSVERFKGLMFQADKDANYIARDTRRGRGNLILVSSDVASALAMAGKLDYAPGMSTDLNVDDSQDTFCGTLNGKYKVYIDPFFSSTSSDLLLVGYKGKSAWDAGLYYCPYVPLLQVRAVDPDTFQPKIGFKTRYGLVGNPFFGSSAGGLDSGTNGYYRKVQVKNLM